MNSIYDYQVSKSDFKYGFYITISGVDKLISINVYLMVCPPKSKVWAVSKQVYVYRDTD